MFFFINLKSIFRLLKQLSINKCNEIVSYMVNISNETTYDEVNQASSSLFEAISNSLIVTFVQILS